MEFQRKSLEEQHYLYVAKEVPYGPEIAEAMGAAFGEVFAFVGQNGLTPLSMPMSVYLEMDPNILRFRAGVLVSEQDAGLANDSVKADSLPAGDAYTGTHVGSYDSLSESHKALWQHMEDSGVKGKMPVWEIYVDDPGETPPEKLRTEIFQMVA